MSGHISLHTVVALSMYLEYLDSCIPRSRRLFLLLLKKYNSNIGTVSGLQLPTTAVFSRSDRRTHRVCRDLRVRHFAHLSRAVGRYRYRRFSVCCNCRISCFASWSPRVQHRDRRSRVARLFVIAVIAAMRLESTA